MSCPRGAASASELFDPGPQFDFQRPRTARLPKDVEIGLRDGLRRQHALWPFGRLRTRRAFNTAADHEMRDVDALGPEFTRRALREAAQGELAHGESRRERKAL